VSLHCRKTLTACCKGQVLRSMPATVQITLLHTLTGLALKRPPFGQEVVSALLQATDFIKTLGACSVIGTPFDESSVSNKGAPNVADAR
jgi:hypothetical protein